MDNCRVLEHDSDEYIKYLYESQDKSPLTVVSDNNSSYATYRVDDKLIKITWDSTIKSAPKIETYI